jgi:uncharacterized protein YjbI with pentapeptide repeats
MTLGGSDMDRDRFDTLTRLLATPGSRRTVLVAILGAGLGARLETAARRGKSAGSKRRAKHKRRRPRRKHGAQAEAAPGCCAAKTCTPGTGKNLSGCCFEGQTLNGKSFKSSNLTGAIFRDAKLANANFSATNLTGACLVDADTTGATFKGANQSGVIRCRTKTSTGIDNSGCSQGTACCPTCLAIGRPCDGVGGSCCGGAECAVGPDGRVCTCPSGRTPCGGECVDLRSDPRHCGACGAQCPAIANAITGCGEATDDDGEPGFGCTYTCFTDFQNCDRDVLGTGCETNVDSNPDHCGFCNEQCGSNEDCCGCLCLSDPDVCSICRAVRSAKLIRTRP